MTSTASTALAPVTAQGEMPCTKTPITAGDLYMALANAWRQVAGSEPTHRALVLLVAHVSIEVGERFQLVYNYNVGNIRHYTDDFPFYVLGKCRKGGTSTARFRAYSSLQEGVDDFVRTIARISPWPELGSGNAAAYAHKLGPAGARYYTASEDQYAAHLRQNQAIFSRDLKPERRSDGALVLLDYTLRDPATMPRPLSAGIDLGSNTAVGFGMLAVIGGYWLFKRKVMLS